MTTKRKRCFVHEQGDPSVKTKVLAALSGEFLRDREDPIGDLTAQITMNERETVYSYRGKEYREPTTNATEAAWLNAKLMAENPTPFAGVNRPDSNGADWRTSATREEILAAVNKAVAGVFELTPGMLPNRAVVGGVEFVKARPGVLARVHAKQKGKRWLKRTTKSR